MPESHVHIGGSRTDDRPSEDSRTWLLHYLVDLVYLEVVLSSEFKWPLPRLLYNIYIAFYDCFGVFLAALPLP